MSFTRKNETNVNENLNNKSKSWINNFKLKRSNTINQRRRIKRHRYRKLNDIKLAFSEFYLMIILLKNYQTLNYTGFCKILKKHDKLFETTRGNEWRYDFLFSY
jgi:SPX domain protein involved in polyphosphate accumulation